MPTYEYACKQCGEHLEVVQSFKDDALTECPACSGTLRKVFSAAGIIFKGSGWHVKDYSSSSRPSTGSGSNESAPEGGAPPKDADSSSEGASKDASKDTSGASSSSSSSSKETSGATGSSGSGGASKSSSSAKKSA